MAEPTPAEITGAPAVVSGGSDVDGTAATERAVDGTTAIVQPAVADVVSATAGPAVAGAADAAVAGAAAATAVRAQSTGAPTAGAALQPAPPSPGLGGEGQFRAHGKWKYFLPSQPKEVRQQLWLDKEASYSVTEEKCAGAMTQLLRLFFGQNDGTGRPRVLDATACVGGNTFSLQREFATIGCEFDPVRYRMLCHNMRVLGAAVDDPARLRLISADLNNLLDRSHPDHALVGGWPLDAVVVDPPWGGPGYVDKDATELFLSGTPLRKIITHAAAEGLVSLFMCKVPLNYDMALLQRELREFDADLRHPKVEALVSGDFRKFRVFVVVFRRPASAADRTTTTTATGSTPRPLRIPTTDELARVPHFVTMERWTSGLVPTWAKHGSSGGAGGGSGGAGAAAGGGSWRPKRRFAPNDVRFESATANSVYPNPQAAAHLARLRSKRSQSDGPGGGGGGGGGGGSGDAKRSRFEHRSGPRDHGHGSEGHGGHRRGDHDGRQRGGHGSGPHRGRDGGRWHDRR